MLFTRCPKGARCNGCNIPDTSRGIYWRVKCWGSGERERRGKEKQARSHKNDIEKKICFYFSCAQKEKIKESNRTEVMRKSQEGLQKPRMDVTLHLALAPSLPGLVSSLAWRSSAELLYTYVCHQFCNCQFGPSSLLCKSATILGSAKEHTVVFVGPSEALTLSSAKGGSSAMILISFSRGVLFLRNKGVEFFQQFSKTKIPLGKC